MNCLKLIFFFTVVFSTGCGTTPNKTKNDDNGALKSNKIIIRQNTQINSTAENDKTIEKDLVHIAVSPKNIFINGMKVRSIQKLKERLGKYSKPVITISAHICADTKLTTDILSLAQSQTDTPIPYGSYGELTDSACK